VFDHFELNDTRSNPDMRHAIDLLLAEGWSITGRDPVRIERGAQAKVVRGRALIDG
jgi:hypothetical protein